MKTPRDVEGDLATEELVDPAEASASAGAIIAPKDVVGRSPWEIFWRQFRKDRWALAGIVVVVIMLLLAITAPLFAKIVHHGPNDVNLRALDDFGLPSGPSKEYWFGVDGTGRDLFIRVLYGARTSLVIAFFATGLALVIGVDPRHGRRLLPRQDRHADLPDHRRGAVAPDPVARARPGVRVRRERRGLSGRADQTGPDAGQPHHRAVQLAVHRAHHPRPGALAA